MNYARIVLIGALLSALAGCSLNPFASKENVDYRSAGKGPQLDVPPDLTAPRYDERFRLAGGGGAVPVLPKLDGVRVERQGNERWLVVDQKVEAVWPQVRAFWQEQGFVLTTDRPDVGVIETDWLENKAKIEMDILRSALAKVAPGLNSTGLRDKFRARLERGANDNTEIYISHRGVEEVATGRVQQGLAQGFTWATRPSDPGLEAEMLNRLLVRLGLPAAQAQQVAAQANSSAAGGAKAVNAPQASALPARARMAAGGLEVDDPFDRAWRRVGLALDRVGFTVVDRDRSQGTYFVRYADDQSGSDKSLIDKVKFWKTDDGPQAEQYRVFLKEGTGKTNVVVQDKVGAAVGKGVSDRILSLLVDQLK
jgi:outer membrane protein assembly factor BamC